jgi:hypothetical protein
MTPASPMTARPTAVPLPKTVVAPRGVRLMTTRPRRGVRPAAITAARPAAAKLSNEGSPLGKNHVNC